MFVLSESFRILTYTFLYTINYDSVYLFTCLPVYHTDIHTYIPTYTRTHSHKGNQANQWFPALLTLGHTQMKPNTYNTNYNTIWRRSCLPQLEISDAALICASCSGPDPPPPPLIGDASRATCKNKGRV